MDLRKNNACALLTLDIHRQMSRERERERDGFCEIVTEDARQELKELTMTGQKRRRKREE